MCKCVNVSMGSYKVSIAVVNPFTKEIVGVDKCIIDEVQSLWDKGIETIESCCGHNKTTGYIAVKEVHILQMISLGYVPDIRTESLGCFLTKTKF